MEHQDKPHWTKPPPQDERLYRYFTNNDLQPGSMHGAFQHMAETSFARGIPDPDGRLINSGAVGFVQRDELELIERGNVDGRKRERPSKAQEHRETAAILAKLEPRHVHVLRMAYGPQDAVPMLKLGANPQARARLDGEESARGKSLKAQRDHYQRREKLGSWRQLMPETMSAVRAFLAWREAKEGRDRMTIIRWLVEHATERELSAARAEAHQHVVEAWGLWVEARGRAQRLPKGWRFERGEET